VVTKLDLLPKGGAKPWDFYRSLGLQVFELSLVDQSIGTPLPEILRFLEGFQRVVFAGHSGVGKTSLLKALTGQEVGATGDVNRETGKGRHTTTSARQIVPTSFVDTPGVKEFGLFDVQSDQLRYLFPEMASLECEAPSCLHVGEDGCEAEKLYRYESYRRIYDSLENL
jgi:ribosome biogenesis GTPase